MPQNAICVVENDTAVRESLALVLGRQDIRVACHPSSSAFLKSVNLDCCACFLFDNELPEMSGIELLEVLRSRRITTPAVIMTVGATPQLTHRAARAGASVLHKPMNPGELLDMLKRSAPEAFSMAGDGAGFENSPLLAAQPAARSGRAKSNNFRPLRSDG